MNNNQSIFMSNRDEQLGLNCPQVGDVWSELLSNRIYVCSIDESGVKVLFVYGGGRRAYLFDDVGEFQDWIMYSSAPVRDLTGWTWCNLMKRDHDNCTETPTWESQWGDQSKLSGIEKPNGLN